MKDLYNLVLDFENNLDKENIIKSLKTSYNIIKNDYKLVRNIQEYKKSNKEVLKNEIINNNNYITTRHYEAELNLLILEINNNLKRLINECDFKWKL